jgi:hypothetical protein
MGQHTLAVERTEDRLGRLAPLAGVGFAALTLAGYFTIGTVPDSGAAISNVTSFYSAHHAGVGTGGMLLTWAAIFLAVFGTAVWARIRQAASNPMLATTALVGTAIAAADQFSGASSYVTLGDIGAKHTILPGALQAWHIGGSGGGSAGGEAIFLLAVGLAGVLTRAVPRWLAGPALAIGVLELTPIGFFASLAFLLWAALAGIVLSLGPTDADRVSVRDTRSAPRRTTAQPAPAADSAP